MPTLNANALTSSRGVFKADPTAPAFQVTGAFDLVTATRLIAEVDGQAVDLPAATAATMPDSPAVGTNYAIWITRDGDVVVSDSHSTPPATGARRIGGFHYAPGGNASAQSGGDSTPAINPYSLWDLKWRPACDPRGMTLVAGQVWVDIYLTGVDAITNGSSAYNVTIADGSSPPKVPTQYGGDGSTTYGTYTWFEAQELAAAFGKRSLTQQEFMAAAYGVTEATSRGSDPVTTGLDAARTSKYGLMQATGNLWAWGRQRGGATSDTATEGRGSEDDAPNAALLGGAWNSSSSSGSRCSLWTSAASASSTYIGSRFACDHLWLE